MAGGVNTLMTSLHGPGHSVGDRPRRYMADRGPSIDSEKAFSDLWERSLELRPEVIGRDGKSYEVVFPGVRNQGPGPDFKGAVLRYEGRTIGGDVELHLDSRGWRAHGHHDDLRYRGVVLQVVLKAQSGSSDAMMPPTAEARFEVPSEHCSSETPPAEMPDLAALGFQRFLAKSAGFRLEIEAVSKPDQVVYVSFLDAMGYARNRRPFRDLAGRVPFDTFSLLVGEPRSTAEFAVLSALAVGGGLLADVERSEAFQMRKIARALGVRRQVSPRAWSRFRVRPSNAPLTRIRGVAPLLAASVRVGLVRTLESIFEHERVSGLIRTVERRPLIGHGLAVTVVANVILPALHAVSLLRGGAGARLIECAFAEMQAPPADAVTRGVNAALGLDVRPRLAIEHFGLHMLARSESWPGASKSPA